MIQITLLAFVFFSELEHHSTTVCFRVSAYRQARPRREVSFFDVSSMNSTALDELTSRFRIDVQSGRRERASSSCENTIIVVILA